jgi:hypothetical protein
MGLPITRSNALLSSVLADVANAVVSTQRELDRLADESIENFPLAPLAFIVKQTQLTLLGNLSAQRGDLFAAEDRALTLALVNRVQASLRGSDGGALGSWVSVSIQAIEPQNGN